MVWAISVQHRKAIEQIYIGRVVIKLDIRGTYRHRLAIQRRAEDADAQRQHCEENSHASGRELQSFTSNSSRRLADYTRSKCNETEIPQMNPKPASMFAFSRPSCKRDAGC